jgi:hypothetical protein
VAAADVAAAGADVPAADFPPQPERHVLQLVARPPHNVETVPVAAHGGSVPGRAPERQIELPGAVHQLRTSINSWMFLVRQAARE